MKSRQFIGVTIAYLGIQVGACRDGGSASSSEASSSEASSSEASTSDTGLVGSGGLDAEPSPYEPTGVVEPAGDLQPMTVEDAEAEFLDLIGTILASDPEHFRNLYLQMMTHADEACPGGVIDVEGSTTTHFWVNECTSSDGTFFAGEVTYTETMDDTSSGWSLHAQAMNTSAPDGTFFRGLVAASAYISPTFLGASVSSGLDVNPEAIGDNPWLRGEIGGYVDIIASMEDGDQRLTFQGALTPGLDTNTQVSGWSLFDFTVSEGVCGQPNVSGAVIFRDRQGSWYDAFFSQIWDVDGEPEEGEEDVCSTCTPLLHQDESLGDTCLTNDTIADLLTWETTPW